MSGLFLPHFTTCLSGLSDPGQPSSGKSYPPIARVVVRESAPRRGARGNSGLTAEIESLEPRTPRLPPVRVQLFQLHLGEVSTSPNK